MPAPQRRNAAGVIDRLLCEPQQFDFFQAVRLLDRWLGGAPEQVRGLSKLNFRNSLSLSFPPSEIEALVVRWSSTDIDRQADAASALLPSASQVAGVDITPAFMGLLGVNGALPLFYTEMLAQRELYQKDQSGRAFMDLFSHRAVSLFYEAWRKHRLPMQFEADRRNRFLPLILALAGMGERGLRDRLEAKQGAVADESMAFYAATLQQRTLSVKQLQQVLQDHLSVPVRIEQFVGRWYRLPEAGRTHLGVGCGTIGEPAGFNGVLGRSATLGERVWQRDLRMRVVIGPLSHGRFQRFLPGEAGARALAELLTLLGGVGLEYEINLQLRREDVGGCALRSTRAPTALRLGWDTFLQTEPAHDDRTDVRYDIHAAA